MSTITYKNTTFAWILFILCPFLSFIRAFYYYNQSWAKNIVWMFCIFFGFTFVLTEGGDANRYIDWFLWMGQHDWSLRTFGSFLYSPETRYVDIAQPLISFSLSRFTQDPRILYAVFGLIFGYFYSRNIWYLLDRAGPKLHPYSLVLLLTFTVLIAFWQINGFRFWTAAHMYLFGVLPYLIEGKKKNLWVTGLSVFFHFSFILPLAALLLYIVLGPRIHLYFIFFIISFFINELDFQAISNLIQNFLPDIFLERSSNYLSETVQTQKNELLQNRSWHARYYLDSLRMALFILVLFTYTKLKNRTSKSKQLVHIFSFSLLFYGIFNILALIPSVGRFLILGNMFLVAFFYFYFQSDINRNSNKKVMLLLLPCFLFFCTVSLRIGFDFLGVSTILGNPVTAFFDLNETSIMSFLK